MLLIRRFPGQHRRAQVHLRLPIAQRRNSSFIKLHFRTRDQKLTFQVPHSRLDSALQLRHERKVISSRLRVVFRQNGLDTSGCFAQPVGHGVNRQRIRSPVKPSAAGSDPAVRESPAPTLPPDLTIGGKMACSAAETPDRFLAEYTQSRPVSGSW